MDYSLKRLLTYSDKNQLEEFGLPEEVQNNLNELYVATKQEVFPPDLTFKKVLNEAFYLLTCVFADQNAAEHVAEYMDHSIVYAKGQYLIQRYILGFVWAVLKMQSNLPKHVRLFFNALDVRLTRENNTHYHAVQIFMNQHPSELDYVFSLSPEFSSGILNRSVAEWKEVTSDFDREVVGEIIHRFRHKSGRNKVLAEIRKALKEANMESSSSAKVSMVTFRNKADDAYLDGMSHDSDALAQDTSLEEMYEERIRLLEKQLSDMKRERDQAIRQLESLTGRVDRKFIPASFKSDEAERIINALVRKDFLSPVWRHDDVGNFVKSCYRWDESKSLFGYFVDKMSARLHLYNAGNQINWREFQHAFSNYEDIVKRARDAVSNYRQHPEQKLPSKSKIIDEIFADGEY